jgi:hypothetical protein
MSVYSLIARGQEVVFPKNTAMEIGIERARERLRRRRRRNFDGGGQN